MSGPWREPDEESLDLYPGLVVHDGRVSGSITFGPTRLPLWAPVLRFEDALEDYGADPAEVQAAECFLHDLLEMRGEFGRLLLVLADAERRDSEREDEALEPYGPVVDITPGRPGAVELPPPWWHDADLRAPVIDQLRRCLAALEGDAS